MAGSFLLQTISNSIGLWLRRTLVRLVSLLSSWGFTQRCSDAKLFFSLFARLLFAKAFNVPSQFFDKAPSSLIRGKSPDDSGLNESLLITYIS